MSTVLRSTPTGRAPPERRRRHLGPPRRRRRGPYRACRSGPGRAVLAPTQAQGRALLETATGTYYEGAVCRAAAEVFLDISRDAVHVFPQWAQWTKLDAFRRTWMGSRPGSPRGRRRHANGRSLRRPDQPANLLPRLQLANLTREGGRRADGCGWRRLGEGEGAGESAAPLSHIGVARSDLVAARYRAGVTPGCSQHLRARSEEERHEEKEAALGRPRHGGLQQTTGPVAAEGRGPSTISRPARPRTRTSSLGASRSYSTSTGSVTATSPGIERRRLRRTIAISRHTLKIRRLGTT